MYWVSNDAYKLIDFYDFDADGTTPVFEFDTPNGDPWNIDDSGIQSSRWQAQIGFRYLF